MGEMDAAGVRLRERCRPGWRWWVLARRRHSRGTSDVPGGQWTIKDPDPGNREAMTVMTPLSGTAVTTYTYDAANRLTHVGGVALTWDDNGNLLEDHEGTDNIYDAANRLMR